MGIFGSHQTRIKRRIARLNLDPYIATAERYFGLKPTEAEQAKREYRHFLLLVSCSMSDGDPRPVVPTCRADALWHAHLLHNRNYNDMSWHLFGSILEHDPKLDAGSQLFAVGFDHTLQLHAQLNEVGFESNYDAILVPAPTHVESTEFECSDCVNCGGCVRL